MLFFFFFKQKTAYEMRISDWSSDVCSSDLFMMSPRPNTGSGRLRSAKAPSILPFGQHTGHAASMRPMTLPRRANRKDARPWNGPDTLIVRPSRISMDIESDLPWHEIGRAHD